MRHRRYHWLTPHLASLFGTGELSGCHNDVHHILEYIKTCHGFVDDDVTLLLDDGKHTAPTAMNIMKAFQTLAAEAKSGDALFVHYSGHGVSVPDTSGDEDDGMDEALVPIDYATAGVVLDDTIFDLLVSPLPKGCQLTCFMDACHSGTMLDLPYGFVADGEMEEMQLNPEFDFGTLIKNLVEGIKERHRKRKDWPKRRLGFS